MSVTRRFNYTGRHKISREFINLEVFRPEKQQMQVDFSLEMEALREKFPNLPGNALILLEPYYKTEAWERIPCGTVDSPEPLLKHSLANHFWEDSVNFNVKIVSVDDGPSRILAWNQSMKAEEADETGKKHRSLLPVVPNPNMGGRFWKLDLDGDQPELHFNPEYNLDGTSPKQIILADPGFRAFAYPCIVEEILRDIVITKADSYDFEEDPTGWIAFAADRLQAGKPPEYNTDESEVPDEVTGWIADVVDRFCQYQDLKPVFESHWSHTNSSDE